MAGDPDNDGAALSIAFICPSISGHANVHLASLRHLITLARSASPPLRLHLISEAPLAARAATLPRSDRHTLEFHTLADACYWQEAGEDAATERRHGPPRLLSPGGLKAYDVLKRAVGMSPGRYWAYYSRALEILRALKPDLDLCVVDVLMAAGPIGAACTRAGTTYGILSPIPSLDFCRMAELSIKNLWKYPAVWSGDPCPVPLARIPKNVALTAVYAYSLLASPNVRAVRVMRNAWGVHCLPLSQLPFHIIPSVPAMEYPHTPPANAILAGPIVVPTPPLTSADDHDLSAFLARGRTALFNMGSLFVFTLADVAAAADAFIEARRRLLPRGGLQVLWKIPHATSFAALLNDKLLGEDRESVRIEEWIGPPALAVLRHPNVVVSIHHGGANSVHEAAYAGVPQIVLPQWLDLYDFAARVEALGHGVHANKGAPAAIDAAQLADALERVLRDRPGEEGHAIRERAREIADACRGAGGVSTVAGVVLGAANIARKDRR